MLLVIGGSLSSIPHPLSIIEIMEQFRIMANIIMSNAKETIRFFIFRKMKV